MSLTRQIVETTHRSTYKRLRKLLTCSCDRCPYHKYENESRDVSGFRSWKKSTRAPHQWMKWL